MNFLHVFLVVSGLSKMSMLKFKRGLFIVGMNVVASSSSFAQIVNTVTVTGTGIDGVVGGVTASDVEEVDVIDANPNLFITKSGNLADTNNNGFADVGETITYTFSVKNNGTVTLIDVGVVDDSNATGVAVVADNEELRDAFDVLPKNDSFDDEIDKKWDVLAPGDTVHFTAEYEVLQSDVNALSN